MSSAFHVEFEPGVGIDPSVFVSKHGDKSKNSWRKLEKTEFDRLVVQANLVPAFSTAVSDLASAVIGASIQIRDSPWSEEDTLVVQDRLLHVGRRAIEHLCLFGFCAVRQCICKKPDGETDLLLPFFISPEEETIYHRRTAENVSQYCIGKIEDDGKFYSATGTLVFEERAPRDGCLSSVLDRCHVTTVAAMSAMVACIRAAVTNSQTTFVATRSSKENEQSLADGVDIFRPDSVMPGDGLVSDAAHLEARQLQANRLKSRQLDADDVLRRKQEGLLSALRPTRAERALEWSSFGIRGSGGIRPDVDQSPSEIKINRDLHVNEGAIAAPVLPEPRYAIELLHELNEQIREAVGWTGMGTSGNSSHSAVTTVAMAHQRSFRSWGSIVSRIFTVILARLVGKKDEYLLDGNDLIGEGKERDAKVSLASHLTGFQRDSGYGQMELHKRGKRRAGPSDSVLHLTQGDIFDRIRNGKRILGQDADTDDPVDSGSRSPESGQGQSSGDEGEEDESSAPKTETKVPTIVMQHMVDPVVIMELHRGRAMPWEEARKFLATCHNIPLECLSKEDPLVSEQKAEEDRLKIESKYAAKRMEERAAKKKRTVETYTHTGVPVIQGEKRFNVDDAPPPGEIINRRLPRRA